MNLKLTNLATGAIEHLPVKLLTNAHGTAWQLVSHNEVFWGEECATRTEALNDGHFMFTPAGWSDVKRELVSSATTTSAK